MRRKILLASFETWEPHQKSNSSDDLISAVLQRSLPENLHFLGKLPVDFQLAPEKTIAHINQLKPDIIVCCVKKYCANGITSWRNPEIVENKVTRNLACGLRNRPLSSVGSVQYLPSGYPSGALCCYSHPTRW